MHMGRKKRENPPWSSVDLALAECRRLLGEKRLDKVLSGLQRSVRRPRRLTETVVLWERLKALGPGLRELKKAIEESWAFEREAAAPLPDDRIQILKDNWEELKVFPEGYHPVSALIRQMEPWIGKWDEFQKEANRIRPRGRVAETNEAETTAMARYLVRASSKWERPITKHIAALLEVAHGLELPKDADARDSAWEKLLDKWKKALTRASRPSRPLAASPWRRAKRKGGTTSS
jgi:hypothetical protein